MNQQPICIDNYGNAVYKCRHTGLFVGGQDAKFTGAFIPGVNAVYVMGNNKQAQAAEKQSRAAFDESEANCNTCKYLIRKPSKVKGGFLYGTCAIEAAEGVMQFHPHDPMHMQCWEGRSV